MCSTVATRPLFSGRLSSGTMTRLILLATIATLVGCSARDRRTLGSAVEGASASIVSVQQSNVESRVVLHGIMTTKCPVAGCWFMLHDDTGTIKVDTKNAGFVVVDVPLNTVIAVAGRVTTNGAERIIDATGVRF